MSNITDVTRRATAKLLRKRGVNAVGIGQEIKDGKLTGRIAIICSVEKKLPIDDIYDLDLVPSEIEGQPTDVVEIGTLKALVTNKFRPAPYGVSIGHHSITAGTFGCLVSKNGLPYILSNNHVLANENIAEIGDLILQPGAIDGGRIGVDTIAVLSDWVPIEFMVGTPPLPPPPDNGGSGCSIANKFVNVVNRSLQFLKRKTRIETVQALPQGDGINYVDAAIAKPLLLEDVVHKIHNSPYGDKVTGVSSNVFVGEAIYKSGRTTDITVDKVLQVQVTADIQYGAGRVARFHDQILSGPMSAGGDSGSLVLDLSNNAVGLLFAGSDSTTIINPIRLVLDELDVEMVI